MVTELLYPQNQAKYILHLPTNFWLCPCQRPLQRVPMIAGKTKQTDDYYCVGHNVVSSCFLWFSCIFLSAFVMAKWQFTFRSSTQPLLAKIIFSNLTISSTYWNIVIWNGLCILGHPLYRGVTKKISLTATVPNIWITDPNPNPLYLIRSYLVSVWSMQLVFMTSNDNLFDHIILCSNFSLWL